MPRGIAEVRWGSAAKLDDAVAKNQCREVKQDGELFYCWKEIKLGERGSNDHTKRIEAPAVELDQATYDKLVGMLDSLKVGFKYDRSDDQAFVVEYYHPCVSGHNLGVWPGRESVHILL